MTAHYFRPIQVSLYSFGFILLGSLGMMNGVSAATCTPVGGGASVTISTNCSDLVLNGAGSVAINSGVTVGAVNAPVYAIDVIGSSATLTNNGIISSTNEGLVVETGATLQTFNNNGTFSGGVFW